MTKKYILLRLVLSCIGLAVAITNIFTTYTNINSHNGVWIIIVCLSSIEFCNALDKLNE